MAEVIWTKPALQDLQSVYDFVAEDSPKYAGRLVDRIIERTEVLRSHPTIGRVVPEFEDSTLCELIEGNYRIVYKVLSETSVAIVRVYHGARLMK